MGTIVFKTDSWAPSPEEGRPAIKVEFHMPADQYDRFRQMAVDLDMTGAAGGDRGDGCAGIGNLHS